MCAVRRAACWSGPMTRRAGQARGVWSLRGGDVRAVGARDQRRWGECYLRGLMLDGERKSIQPMAERLPDGDEQALQQFVSQSPWDWRPVCSGSRTQMAAVVDPDVWVIDDTGFPKHGNASVGVPGSLGHLGKVANCQIGVSMHAASDQASCRSLAAVPARELGRRRARRRAAHVPSGWVIDPSGSWCWTWWMSLPVGAGPPVVVADAGYGESGSCVWGWRQRGLAMWCRSRARPARTGGGRPGAALCRAWASSRRATAPAVLAGELVWQPARPGPRRSPGAKGSAASCARGLWPAGPPAGVKLRRAVQGGELPVRWLLAEWPADQPSRQVLAGQPARTRRWWSWSAWPSCVGEWSTTTASSRRLGWTTRGP